VLLLAVTSLPLDAQGSIRGTLVDSLRAAAPIADGRIELVGAGRSVRSDPRGRFEFQDLAPGRYVLRYASAALDSVGIAYLLDTVEVSARGRTRVTLAVPSVTWFQRSLCAAESERTGVVRGRIADLEGRAQAGVAVSALWGEAVLHGNAVVTESRSATATTAADGTYAVCAVPTGRRFELRAGDGARGSGAVVVEFTDAPVLRRDLRIAARELTTVVTGTARARRRSAEIRVEVWGDSTRSVRVDSTGRFRIVGVPRRTGQLYFRAVGQVPRVVTIEPTGPTLDVGEVRFEDAAVALQPMTIRERELTRERLAFDERSRGAVGVFYDSAFLSRAPRVTAAYLASKSTAVRVGAMREATAITGEVILLRNIMGLEGCYPRVYLNGMFLATQEPQLTLFGQKEAKVTPDMMKDLLRTAQRIEIYRAQFAPAEFADPEGCGSIVIWTR
jgi:hypothetical protein